MEPKIPDHVEPELRKIIVAHSHVIMRVRRGDERTMRLHTMSMMDAIEKVLVKNNEKIFTWKKSTNMYRLMQLIVKRKRQYSNNKYVNDVCLIMQFYRYQVDLVNPLIKIKGGNVDEAKSKKKKYTDEAVVKLFNITL